MILFFKTCQDSYNKCFLIKEKPQKVASLKNFLESYYYNVIGVAASYQEVLLLYNRLPIYTIIIDMYIDGKPDGIAFIENQDFYGRAKLTKPFAV